MRRVFVLVLAALLILPASASALTVSKAELKDGQLRIEGSGTIGGVFVVASSTTSSTGARGDVNGNFNIQASNFTAPDCIVNVNDGRTTSATVKPSGCTASVTPKRHPISARREECPDPSRVSISPAARSTHDRCAGVVRDRS